MAPPARAGDSEPLPGSPVRPGGGGSKAPPVEGTSPRPHTALPHSGGDRAKHEKRLRQAAKKKALAAAAHKATPAGACLPWGAPLPPSPPYISM